jgi:hypothetical protein
VFGDDAARVVVFVKAFQPLWHIVRSCRTVTRYVTQVNNVSKIVAFLSAPRCFLPAGIGAALLHGWQIYQF